MELEIFLQSDPFDYYNHTKDSALKGFNEDCNSGFASGLIIIEDRITIAAKSSNSIKLSIYETHAQLLMSFVQPTT